MIFQTKSTPWLSELQQAILHQYLHDYYLIFFLHLFIHWGGVSLRAMLSFTITFTPGSGPVQPVWFAPLELAEPCSVVVMTASVTVRPSLHCNYINYYVRNTNKCSKNFFVRMLKSSHIKKASARKPNKWARDLGLCLGSVVGGPMLRLCLAGDGDSQVRRHWYSPVAKRWSSNKFLLL